MVDERLHQNAILVVHGHGEIPAIDAAEFLSAMDDCYRSIFTFEAIVTSFERHRPWRYVPEAFGAMPWLSQYWTSTYLPDLVPTGHGLQLRAVTIASPGVWEFLGKLNPLEQARRYLKDRHERQKDRAYRSQAEEDRLNAEQAIREIEVIDRALSAMERVGASKEDMAPLLSQLVHRPLERLGRLQDKRVIEHAEIKKIEDLRPRPRPRGRPDNK